MAKQVITRLVDDLDGGDADESVTFGMDGVTYNIDLSGKNAAGLREVLAPYVAAGRKAGRAVTVVSARKTNRELNEEIRGWAARAGKHIAARGRIPQVVVDEFHAERGQPAWR